MQTFIFGITPVYNNSKNNSSEPQAAQTVHLDFVLPALKTSLYNGTQGTSFFFPLQLTVKLYFSIATTTWTWSRFILCMSLILCVVKDIEPY